MESNYPSSEKRFVIVNKQEAKKDPYPYVYIEDDGAVRELRSDERAYLETEFLPMDGGRPAVKNSFESRNGWGSIQGFCLRSKIPANIRLLNNETPIPENDQDQADKPDDSEPK